MPVRKLKPEIVKEIASRIKESREKSHLTQQALANALGIAKRSVTAWEGGTNVISVLQLRRLCRGLNVSADFILGMDGKAT